MELDTEFISKHLETVVNILKFISKHLEMVVNILKARIIDICQQSKLSRIGSIET